MLFAPIYDDRSCYDLQLSNKIFMNKTHLIKTKNYFDFKIWRKKKSIMIITINKEKPCIMYINISKKDIT